MGLASDIAFTETVKAIQTRKGSRSSYAGAVWQTKITPDLTAYVANMRSIFVSTVNAQGYPYIQHRGGPAGFLHVLDESTIAFADFKGNQQFITQGNLEDNSRTFIFMIDFQNKQRVKLWGHSEIIENDPDLLAKLMPDQSQYRALPEQIFKFTVETWDVNCPQHIPQRFEAEDVTAALRERDEKITQLEAELAQLREQGNNT